MRLDGKDRPLAPRRAGRRPKLTGVETKRVSPGRPAENPVPGPAQPAGAGDEANCASPRPGDRGEARDASGRNPPYQGDQPETTSPLPSGGERHLSLVPDLQAGGGRGDHPAQAPAGPGAAVTAHEYAEARDLLLTLPDFGGALLARARSELAAAGPGVVAYPLLVVRAAQIAARPESRSA
jgi:hypothetical protein